MALGRRPAYVQNGKGLPGAGGDCRFVCVVKDPESREIGLRLRERYRGLEICGPGELEKLLGAGL